MRSVLIDRKGEGVWSLGEMVVSRQSRVSHNSQWSDFVQVRSGVAWRASAASASSAQPDLIRRHGTFRILSLEDGASACTAEKADAMTRARGGLESLLCACCRCYCCCTEGQRQRKVQCCKHLHIYTPQITQHQAPSDFPPDAGIP